MSKLVSILIPLFNAERWIASTIQSAVGQTWPSKEIIIVDDGSSDRSLAIARSFEGRNIKVVSQKNQGAAAARNHAYRLCQGDYIQWLDADDLLAPDKVEHQMALVETGEAGPDVLLSGGWAPFMYRTSKAKFIPSRLWADVTPVEWMMRKFEDNVHMQTATWLVSRELTERAGPWDSRLLGDDDGEYFSRVIIGAEQIRFVGDARVFYRVVGANRLSYIGRSEAKMNAQFGGMKMQIGYLRRLADDERARAACVNYLQTWMASFYPERADIFEEAQVLAGELGGALRIPVMSWKYEWIRRCFGWPAAKFVQERYNITKTGIVRGTDWCLWLLDGRS